MTAALYLTVMLVRTAICFLAVADAFLFVRDSKPQARRTAVFTGLFCPAVMVTLRPTLFCPGNFKQSTACQLNLLLCLQTMQWTDEVAAFLSVHQKNLAAKAAAFKKSSGPQSKA